MIPEIILRQALPTDLDAVVAIENTCFEPDEVFSRRELSYLIARAQGECRVACCDERVVGYSSLLVRRTACNLRIYSLAVDPDFRGAGVGGRLVEDAVTCARRRGATSVTLEVRVDNSAALHLYSCQGFTPLRRLVGYYPDGVDAYRMSLAIR